MSAAVQEVAGLPDMKVSVRQLFGIDSDMEVPAYSQADEHANREQREPTLFFLASSGFTSCACIVLPVCN